MGQKELLLDTGMRGGGGGKGNLKQVALVQGMEGEWGNISK